MKRKYHSKYARFVKKYKSQIGKQISITCESPRGMNKTLMYIKLTDHKIKETRKISNNEIFIDYDRIGRVVGIEII